MSFLLTILSDRVAISPEFCNGSSRVLPENEYKWQHDISNIKWPSVQLHRVPEHKRGMQNSTTRIGSQTFQWSAHRECRACERCVGIRHAELRRLMSASRTRATLSVLVVGRLSQHVRVGKVHAKSVETNSSTLHTRARRRGGTNVQPFEKSCTIDLFGFFLKKQRKSKYFAWFSHFLLFTYEVFKETPFVEVQPSRPYPSGRRISQMNMHSKCTSIDQAQYKMDY